MASVPTSCITASSAMPRCAVKNRLPWNWSPASSSSTARPSAAAAARCARIAAASRALPPKQSARSTPQVSARPSTASCREWKSFMCRMVRRCAAWPCANRVNGSVPAAARVEASSRRRVTIMDRA